MRVYIAKKLTFTTLIDHFTSLRAVWDTALPLRALVYSYQLIKLGLLTQSIRQQKLPPHMRNSAFDPAVRVALALGRFAGGKGDPSGGRVLLWKDSKQRDFPI